MRPAGRLALALACTSLSSAFVIRARAVSAAPTQHFDAVSVKRAVGPSPSEPLRIDPQRLLVDGPVWRLILNAYDLDGYQLSRGPDWIYQERYLVEGKTDNPVQRAEMMQMLQAVLADRFQVRLIRASKVVPVFALIVAPGGLRVPPLAADAPQRTPHGLQLLFKTTTELTREMNHFVKGDSDPTQAERWALERPVVDQTGLSGEYDIRLTMPGAERNGDGFLVPEVDFGTLVQPLGLRLSPAKAAIEFVTIKDVERPIVN